MKTRPPALALLLLALFCAHGCSATRKEPEPLWTTGEVAVSSDRVLWKVTLLALEKQGFPLAGGVDPSSGVLTTGWRSDLAPFAGEGRRTQAEIRFAPVGPGTWEVKARVKQQKNASISKPLDPRYADWEWMDDDIVAANVLVQHIRSRLAPAIELEKRPQDALEALLEAKEAETKKP